jgi:hypothetical protein
MIKMYLSEKQEQLFLNELNNLVGDKKITVIEEKRIRNLFYINQKIKDEDNKEVTLNYVEFIPNEILKMKRAIKRHPELREELHNLIEKTNDVFENGVIFYSFLCDLIKLEAALGMKINHALEYPIDRTFEEYYMEIINHHYVQNHDMVKKLSR